MKMRYEGADGSLGFSRGDIYDISIGRYKRHGVSISTVKRGRFMYCCYDTIESFLNIWKEV